MGEAAWHKPIAEMGRVFTVEPIRPIKGKRARLHGAAHQDWAAKFSRCGCEQLLTPFFSFGAEKGDDAVDAPFYLVLGLIDEGIVLPDAHYL
jgi:hypothetical protein